MVKPISAKQKRAFNKAATHPLQSWEWGEFRQRTGNEVVRLGLYKDKMLEQAVTLTLHKIPGSPYKIGAFIRGGEPKMEIINSLKALAQKEKLLFIKMEPNIAFREKVRSMIRGSGAVPGKTLFTPTTFVIDLAKDEDELLAGFDPKTRYNVRYATKKGVEVLEDNSDKAFERYIALTRETVKRQKFYAHTEKYHRLMWETLHTDMVKRGEEPIARLLTARHKKEILTTWILFAWHDTLYYPYGASTTSYKNIQANSRMMWEAMLYGKSQGMKYFDLWGREEGKGFTRFKEGFNPKIKEFIGTWDLITSPLYWPYRIAEAVRWGFLRVRNKFTEPEF